MKKTSGLARAREITGSLSLWERVRVRAEGSARNKKKNIFLSSRSFAPHPVPLPKGDDGCSFLSILMLALLMLVSISAAIAQDTDRIDPQLTNTPLPTYVIRNARIVTVSGAEIENGTLVISGGKIAAVGADVSAP